MKKAMLIFLVAACLLCSCARNPDQPDATSGPADFSAQDEHAIEIPVVDGPSLSTILSELKAAPAGLNK